MSNGFLFVFIAFFSGFTISQRLELYLPRDVVEVILPSLTRHDLIMSP
jgi:hypothetical protein